MSDTLTPAEADYAMRHWTYRSTGQIKIGSAQHKRMFCEMLLTTHNPYKPAVIDWPMLAAAVLKRVTSLPIWDIAVQTEGRASIRVSTFARSIKDPLLREAVTMNGAEEARHKIVLSRLVQAYGIELAFEPPYAAPKDALRAWMLTGYSECIDSFFAFGLFEAARQSGYFPEEFVETFEPVIQAVVPAALVSHEDRQRVVLADPRPYLAGAGIRHQRRLAGYEFSRERGRFCGRRGIGEGAGRSVPDRKRAPHGRLRRPSLAAGNRAPARPDCSAVY
jgi:hypothetical protein